MWLILIFIRVRLSGSGCLWDSKQLSVTEANLNSNWIWVKLISTQTDGSEIVWVSMSISAGQSEPVWIRRKTQSRARQSKPCIYKQSPITPLSISSAISSLTSILLCLLAAFCCDSPPSCCHLPPLYFSPALLLPLAYFQTRTWEPLTLLTHSLWIMIALLNQPLQDDAIQGYFRTA